MGIAFAAAGRSTCPRAKVGAVLVTPSGALYSGYNGAPRGLAQCDTPSVGCALVSDGERERCIRAVHAEANALLQAPGVGGDLYTTHAPCVECAKLIINAKVESVFYAIDYRDANVHKVTAIAREGRVIDWLTLAGVKVSHVEGLLLEVTTS